MRLLSINLAILIYSALTLYEVSGALNSDASGTFIANAKELKTKLKVLLTDLKLRKVPMAKAKSEKALAKLYRRETSLSEEIKELEDNLRHIENNVEKNKARLIEFKSDRRREKNSSGGDVVTANQITTSRLGELRSFINSKKVELRSIKGEIVQAKQIIKHPERFVSVPDASNLDVESYRQKEKDANILDRENILFRYELGDRKSKRPKPYWLTDSW